MSKWEITTIEAGAPPKSHVGYANRAEAEAAARRMIDEIRAAAPSQAVTVGISESDLTRPPGTESAKAVVLGHWDPDKGWVEGSPAPG